MRQLTTNDIFKLSRILKKLNVKINTENKTDEQFGMDLIIQIAENAYIAQSEINEFLADLSGMSVDEFAKLPIKDFMQIIKEFKQLDGINDFFNIVGQSTN